MALTWSDVRTLLNRISPGSHRAKLGDLLYGTAASGTIVVSGISEGTSKMYDVPHDATYSNAYGSCTAAASFVGALPVPEFTAPDGFIVTLSPEALSATGFRVLVTRVASKVVYAYAGSTEDESGGATATLTWTRTGAVLPS